MLRTRTVVLVLGFLLGGLAAAATGPLIQISERAVDFGTLDQFNQYHHALTVSNQGDAPLRLLKVETSCGCTVGVPSDSVVQPGQQAKVDISFESGDREGDQEKIVTIHTNDPAEPVVKITVRANVKPAVRMSDTRIAFDPIRRGTSDSRTIRFSADKGSRLSITRIEGGEDYFTTKIVPEPSEKEDVLAVTFTIKPEAPAGNFHKIVKVMTTGAIARTCDVLATGSIVSYFEVEGDARLRMPPTPKGKPAVKEVTIRCDGSKPYELGRIESNQPYLRGELIPQGGGVTVVRITATEAAPAGAYQGVVKLHTTDPAQPTIEWIVQGLVRGADASSGGR